MRKIVIITFIALIYTQLVCAQNSLLNVGTNNQNAYEVSISTDSLKSSWENILKDAGHIVKFTEFTIDTGKDEEQNDKPYYYLKATDAADTVKMVTSLILRDDVFYIEKKNGAIFYGICIGTYDCEPRKYDGDWICGITLICGPDCIKLSTVEID